LKKKKNLINDERSGSRKIVPLGRYGTSPVRKYYTLALRKPTDSPELRGGKKKIVTPVTEAPTLPKKGNPVGGKFKGSSSQNASVVKNPVTVPRQGSSTRGKSKNGKTTVVPA